MDFLLTGALQKAVAKIGGGRGVERGPAADQFSVEPGFYPLTDAGPLGQVRAVDGNHMYINNVQLGKLRKLNKKGVIPEGAITPVGRNLYLASWEDENGGQK